LPLYFCAVAHTGAIPISAGCYTVVYLKIMDNKGQNLTTFIIFILVIAIILTFMFFGISVEFSFMLVLFFIVFAIAFINVEFALIILIFSMLFSPEIQIGHVYGRAIVVRSDDIFLFLIFFGWLARTAIDKELGLLRITPLNRPIAVYVVFCLATTILGFMKGYLALGVSIFYLLKYFEYFILFFMVTNNLKSMKQVKSFVFSLLLVGFLVGIYAFSQHFHGVERVTAPFEGKSGEANTLGGYLVLIICIVIGLILNFGSLRQKMFFAAILIFAFPALVFTLSRGSWLAFIPALIALILFTRKGKLVLFIFSFAAVLLSSIILPRSFYARVNQTFSYGKEYEIAGRRVRLEDSAATRIEIFKLAMQKWKKEPLLGYGIGSSLPILDNQYARIIIESGFLGLLSFIWIIFVLFMIAFRHLSILREDGFSSGLITGFIACLFGLVVHGIGAETFIIIRIMEPFWFLAAIVVALPRIQEEERLSPA